MPIWGALLAFTGLFVIYFIVLKCTSTKKSDKSNAEIEEMEEIEENKAFEDGEKPEVQNDTNEGRVSASEFKIISRKLHYLIQNQDQKIRIISFFKVGCDFRMIVVSLMPQAVFSKKSCGHPK